MRKRAEMVKQTRKLFETSEFREYISKQTDECTRNAFAIFCLVSADYLYRNFNCKKAGLEKFLDFIEKSIDYINEDSDYFKLMNDAFIDEIGLDVLARFDMKIVEGKKDE